MRCTLFNPLALISLTAFAFSTLMPLPAAAQPARQVDVFLVLDDSGSFASFGPAVRSIFAQLADDLDAALPGADFAFGVGALKDFGGPGWDYCSNRSNSCADDQSRRISGRPFYLNQPIVTVATAGSREARNALIVDALSRSAPGTGGDDPESQIEALWQIANGTGFDGNGDGLRNGFDGTEVAGALETQTDPDQSGDVPAFSSLSPGVSASGTVGGAGFRAGSLRLVIVATEICAALPFSAGTTIPATIRTKYSTEEVADMACFSVRPGVDRFGFVGNAKSAAANTIANAVVPSGAATVPQTIASLVQNNFRVLAMGPGLAPKPKGTGPGHEPSSMLSALARLTGAVDEKGRALVFDIGSADNELRQRLTKAIVAAALANDQADKIIEADLEDKGCRNENVLATVSALKLALRKQRAHALRLVRRYQISNLRSAQSQISRTMSAANRAMKALPRQTLVCPAAVCPSTSFASQVSTVGKASRTIDSFAKSSLARIKNRAAKRLEALKRREVRRAAATLVSNLPGRSSRCDTRR